MNKKKSWEDYLKRKYGDNPTCEICDKVLKWNGRKGEVVHFDHRNGNEIILRSPSNWIRSNYCTQENISIWEQCDFGILCHRCNSYLPTRNRRKFVSSIVKYVFKI